MNWGSPTAFGKMSGGRGVGSMAAWHEGRAGNRLTVAGKKQCY